MLLTISRLIASEPWVVPLGYEFKQGVILTRRAWDRLASSGHTHTSIVAVRPRHHLTFNGSNNDSPNLSRFNVGKPVHWRNIDWPIGRDWEMRIYALKRWRHIPTSRDGWSGSRIH